MVLLASVAFHGNSARKGVTVNAVDANWNVINTNDTIRILSTDANATLPANTALVSGTRTFALTNKTAGSWTVTASNATHNTYTPNVSPAFKSALREAECLTEPAPVPEEPYNSPAMSRAEFEAEHFREMQDADRPLDSCADWSCEVPR